jgi:uncharacterized protein
LNDTGGVWVRQKATIITLGVQKLSKSLEFYEKGLGWKKSNASNESIAFFDLGGVVLSLYPWDLLAEDANVSCERGGFSGMTLAYNAKSTEEVDAVLALSAKSGARIMKQAQHVFWGGYSGYFADPDGHLWEVAWNPHFAFDDRDSLVIP